MRALSRKKEPVRVRTTPAASAPAPAPAPAPATSHSTRKPAAAVVETEEQRLAREEYNRKMEAIRNGVAQAAPEPEAPAAASPMVSRVVVEESPALRGDFSSTDAMARKEEERLARMMGRLGGSAAAAAPAATRKVATTTAAAAAAATADAAPATATTADAPTLPDASHEPVVQPTAFNHGTVVEEHIPSLHSGSVSNEDDMERKEQERMARAMGGLARHNAHDATVPAAAAPEADAAPKAAPTEADLLKQVLGHLHQEQPAVTSATEHHAAKHKPGGKEDVLLSFGNR